MNRMHGTRGRVADVVDPRQARKIQLVETAIKEQELSWRIKTRHDEDDWPVLVYDLQWREGMPGAIILVDRDTDMDVKIYPAGMWFDMSCMAVVNGEFSEFLPHQEYLRDLADRLIEEEQQKLDDMENPQA